MNRWLECADRALLELAGGPFEFPHDVPVSIRGLWDRERTRFAASLMVLYRAVAILLVALILFFVGRAAIQAFSVGPQAENTKTVYQHTFPTAEATPTAQVMKSWIQDNWLSIQQSDQLKTTPNINLVELL